MTSEELKTPEQYFQNGRAWLDAAVLIGSRMVRRDLSLR